jgi:eukaryotic-like serine/threonine-protein kinase
MTRLNAIDGYDVLAILGHGARSTIYAVQDAKDNQIYALKRVVKTGPADQRYLDQATKEHEVAVKLNHPALRKSYKLIRHREVIRVTEIYVLMEMIDGVTMEQHKTASMLDMVALIQQVALGLGAMHKAGFVHADIKPNNILVTGEKQVKIIDFGQSCEIGTVKERIQGTPDFIAPEQVLRREITPQTDVFNLGATMYWLLTGKHVPTLIPKSKFAAGTVIKPNENAINDPTLDGKLLPPREHNAEVPPALSSLVMSCLETEPRERPETMQILHDRLELAVGQLQRESKPPEKAEKPSTKRRKSMV